MEPTERLYYFPSCHHTEPNRILLTTKYPAMSEFSANTQRLNLSEAAKGLHDLLKISDRDWHQLKTDRHRRASEQISAALIHALQANGPGDEAAVELLESALRWLKREQRDPGCPHS